MTNVWHNGHRGKSQVFSFAIQGHNIRASNKLVVKIIANITFGSFHTTKGNKVTQRINYRGFLFVSVLAVGNCQ